MPPQVDLLEAETDLVGATEEAGRSLRETKPRLICTNRCVKFCAGKTGEAAQNCASKFVVNHCQPFGNELTATIKSNCATDAQCTGGKRCSDKLCVRPGTGKCCTDEKMCGTTTCVKKGKKCPPSAPSFAPTPSSNYAFIFAGPTETTAPAP
jgi:hypothetical protein